ncbi:hypothetical protein RSAG8_07327, partial [Rhizoctonia solani AG-8 WAC10335]
MNSCDQSITFCDLSTIFGISLKNTPKTSEKNAWTEQVEVIDNQNIEITGLNKELCNTHLTNKAYQDQLKVLQE